MTVLPVPEDLIHDLLESMKQGPMLTEADAAEMQRMGFAAARPGMRMMVEQLVANHGPLRIEIRADEHPPPHFHVLYAGEDNSFAISDGEPIYPKPLKKWFGNIKDWHARNKPRLIEVWNTTRPTDCQVGPYYE